uniref:Uncharacterized protein n=1 Tax=Sphaerodactylus townsendi TaxID=933632 RepID=A0ACB8F3V6_9SAUR
MQVMAGLASIRFLQCVGAIDGCHIRICHPSGALGQVLDLELQQAPEAVCTLGHKLVGTGQHVGLSLQVELFAALDLPQLLQVSISPCHLLFLGHSLGMGFGGTLIQELVSQIGQESHPLDLTPTSCYAALGRAWVHGDPRKVAYPTDSYGQFCGQKGTPNE